MENAIDWSLVPDGTINCNNIDRYLRIVNGRVITPPEEKIDIFTLTDKFIPDWNSKVTLQKYEDLTKVYLDIETTRINRDWSTEENAKNGRLIMIGVRNERGKNIVIRDDSEVNMLQELSRILDKKKPDVILTFNGLRYDLPYLHAKYKQYALKSPFWIYDNAPLRYGMARIAGRPWDAEYRPVYCKFGGKKCAHVDVYYLAIGFDAVMRRFTKFTLKSLPIQMGLRSEERLDLGIEGIEKCIAERDWRTLGEYLAYDLEDTEILANVFMPGTYYQLKYFPKYNLQSVAMAGNASKWNSILSLHYGAEYVDKLPDPIISCFQGAITFAKAGLFKDVVSFDFSGQYPSSMMAYGISSKNDPDNLMLAVVKSAVNYRNSIKYRKDKTKEDDDLATAVKPLVNSSYGSLAAFIPFGDSIAAAKVTLFARARLKWSKGFVEKLGGEVVLSDTDSLYIRTTRMDAHLEFPISEKNMALMPPDASPQMLSAYAIGLELERNIPEGSKLDFDGCYKVLFVPPTETPDKFDKTYKFCTPKGRKFVSEVLSDEKFVDEYISSNYYDENITYSTLQEISDKFDLGFPQYQAVKKNYIKIVWDIKKQEWKTKAKGRYGKRDVSKLEKEFQQKYIEKYAVCPDDAKKYYEDLRKKIMSGEYDTNNLMTVRKIRHGEVTLVNLGFGRPGDEVKFYQGYGHPTNTEKYNKYHYTKLIEELYLEIACFLGMTPTAPKSQQFKQLKLFDIA